MGSRWTRVHLAVSAFAVAGFLVVPDNGLVQMIWMVAGGWFAAVSAVLGVRYRRPAWWLIALGVAGNASGVMVEYVRSRLGLEAFPSWADVAYLSLYPSAAAGLFLIIKRRVGRRDWSSLVDASIISVGLGLLAWVFMVVPAASDPEIGLVGHLASAAYPVGDIVLLAMVVRLLLTGSGRNRSFQLLSGGLLCFLTGDTIWAVINELMVEPGPLGHKLLTDVYLLGFLTFGAAAVHPDARGLARTVAARPPRPGLPLLITLALTTAIGPALLFWQAIHHRVTDGVAIAIGCTALFLLVVVRMAQLLAELNRQTRRVQELAVTDELTGLPNRRAWNTELPRALERAMRRGPELVVALLDIDHFKLFNDSFGHPAGDRLLKEAAAAWQGELRTADLLARYGGEEFAVLLTADPGTAREIVDRMRRATPRGQSISAGIAVWNGTETSDDLVARADAALYRAKQTGRNRIAEAADETVRRL